MRGTGTLAIGALLACAAIPGVARAQVRTASVSDGAPMARVEPRRFPHDGRLFVRAGFSWWSRDDLRTNPGVTAEATWYLAETIGLDVLSATAYFSQLASAADALRRQTGLLPDSQKPLARVMVGARWGFVYGKFLLEGTRMVVHADAALRAHAGVVITDQSANPAGDLGLAVQARLGEHALVWIDGAWLAGYEQREGTRFASGLSLSAGVGVTW